VEVFRKLFALVLNFKVFLKQDWARTHSGDKDVDAALANGADPGISLVSSRQDIHLCEHAEKD